MTDIIPITSTKQLPSGELYLFDNVAEAMLVPGTIYKLTRFCPKEYDEFFVASTSKNAEDES
jgi:hypothetical protein